MVRPGGRRRGRPLSPSGAPGGRGAGPSPLDPATSGWHLTPRAWRASEVYRALRTAEARHVAELILFDRPRFQDEVHYFGGRAFTVRRGQLFDSEAAIAAAAGTSRKVVRTVIAGLQVAGLVAREKACGGARSPHVITVLDYALSQDLPGPPGPRAGPREGQQRARERAPSKPQEPQEPQEPLAPAKPPPAPREPVLELFADAPAPPPPPSPHQVAVRAWCERWERAGRGKRPTLIGAEGATIKRLVEELGVEELVARMDRAFQDPWFLEKGDLLMFGRMRARFAAPGRPAPRGGAGAGQGPTAPPTIDVEALLAGLPGARKELDERLAGLTKEAAARMLPSIVEALRMEWSSRQAAGASA